jgi:hypothetical protein
MGTLQPALDSSASLRCRQEIDSSAIFVLPSPLLAGLLPEQTLEGQIGEHLLLVRSVKPVKVGSR